MLSGSDILGFSLETMPISPDCGRIGVIIFRRRKIENRCPVVPILDTLHSAATSSLVLLTKIDSHGIWQGNRRLLYRQQHEVWDGVLSKKSRRLARSLGCAVISCRSLLYEPPRLALWIARVNVSYAPKLEDPSSPSS